MRRGAPFDEVMIVNPSEGGTNSEQRVRLMRFHNIYPPALSGFAQTDPYGYYAQPGYGAYAQPGYGYYGQPGYGAYAQPQTYDAQQQTYGSYGQPEIYPQPHSFGYYGQPYGYAAEDPYLSEDSVYGDVDPSYGYYGQLDPAYGYYGQVDPGYGYYAQPPEFEGYAYGQYEPQTYAQNEPVGYYAAEEPLSYYSQAPEMVGYGQPESQYEEYPGVAYYGEPDYSGYVREQAAGFNPGCPLPTNVSGFDDSGFAGYVRPMTVNATCDQFTEQPGSAPAAPDTFKPLW